MNVPNVRRGRRQTFQYGNDTLSITELPRKPEVVGYLERDRQLTYASQREKLRKLLREGNINPQLVAGHAARNPVAPRVQDVRYGAQRRQAGLPRSARKTSLPAKCWNDIPDFVSSSNRGDRSTKSPCSRRCESGFERIGFQTTPSGNSE